MSCRGLVQQRVQRQVSIGLDDSGFNGLKKPSLRANADDSQWTVVLQSGSAFG